MRFKELDLLRFLAALSVVFYHYISGFADVYFNHMTEITKFGYLGVPLFFMISGFVIFASADNRTPGEFAISRLTRVYPTLFVCTTLTVLILYVCDGEVGVSVLQYLVNLTLLNTYAGIEYIDNVYWTLLAELKFYFCIFILLVLGLFKHYKIWLSVWMIFTITFYFYQQPFFMGGLISPEYSAYFIAGIVFFLIRREGLTGFYAMLMGISLAMASIKTYGHTQWFIAEPSDLSRLIAVCIVWSFYALFFLLSLDKIKLRDSTFLLTLGGMTYPLYLMHSRAGRSLFEHYLHMVNPYLLLCLILVYMLLLSYLVHMYVEKKWANSLKNYLLDKHYPGDKRGSFSSNQEPVLSSFRSLGK